MAPGARALRTVCLPGSGWAPMTGAERSSATFNSLRRGATATNDSVIGPAGTNVPVAVVTGASARLGRATAVAFARRGWRVALLARGQAGLEGAHREVEAAGGQALTMPLDVADAAAVCSAADHIVEKWGRLDVWINNAKATVFGPADRVPSDEWTRVTDVTDLGAVHGSLAALKHMRA